MLKFACLFCFAAFGAAYAQDQQNIPKDKVRFRLKYGGEKAGLISKYDQSKLWLNIDGLIVPYLWEELTPEDAAFLKGKLFGEAAPVPKTETLLIRGIQVLTNDGKTYEGFELPESNPAALYLKTAKGVVVLNTKFIVKKTDADLEISKILTAEEILQMLITKMAPKTSSDYQRIADQLFKVKLYPQAQQMLELSLILQNPGTAGFSVQNRLIVLRDKVNEVELKRVIYDIQKDSIDGELENVMKKLEELYLESSDKKASPDILEEIKNLKAIVYQLVTSSKNDRVVSEFYLAAEALVLFKTLEPGTTLKSAVDYAKNKLMDEIYERVASRVKLAKGDPYIVATINQRSSGIVKKHSFDEGSFLLNIPREDAEAAWSGATNDARFKFLYGIFVEKRLDIISEADKNCPECGGKGFITTDIDRRCPVCAGVKKIRVLLYR